MLASLILFSWSCLNLEVPVHVLDMASISEAPEWKCVVKLIDRASDSSKFHNYRVQCIFCEKQYSGSSTRTRAHELGIAGIGVAPCRNTSAIPPELSTRTRTYHKKCAVPTYHIGNFSRIPQLRNQESKLVSADFWNSSNRTVASYSTQPS